MCITSDTENKFPVINPTEVLTEVHGSWELQNIGDTLSVHQCKNGGTNGVVFILWNCNWLSKSRMQSCVIGHNKLPGIYCWVRKRKKSQVSEPYIELELDLFLKICVYIYSSMFIYVFIHTKISGRENEILIVVSTLR